MMALLLYDMTFPACRGISWMRFRSITRPTGKTCQRCRWIIREIFMGIIGDMGPRGISIDLHMYKTGSLDNFGMSLHRYGHCS